MTSSFCQLWPGRLDRDGYGRFDKKTAHRVVWEGLHGEIPAGMVVDHICFNRACVNPDHLQLLTVSENARRQRSALATHCRRGHEFTPENLTPNAGRRRCKKCAVTAATARKRAKRKVSEPVEHGRQGDPGRAEAKPLPEFGPETLPGSLTSPAAAPPSEETR